MLERRAPKVWGAEISEIPATIHFHASFLAVLDHPINAIPDVLGCTPRSVSVVRKLKVQDAFSVQVTNLLLVLIGDLKMAQPIGGDAIRLIWPVN